ncbi:MAG: hypothetical protein QOH90_413 [Actinomycetota bacterium]|nr:hypothetical protein [Actinomycetota bacterium]
MKKAFSLGVVTCLLLAGAAVAFASAWRIQAVAAERLELTQKVQDREIAEVETDHPSPEVNRKILQNLARAKEVRNAIDDALRRIASSVSGLERQQGASTQTIRTGSASLRRLVRALGGAIGPATASKKQLVLAVQNLHGSRGLAAKIVAELRKLDQKLGGPVP